MRKMHKSAKFDLGEQRNLMKREREQAKNEATVASKVALDAEKEAAHCASHLLKEKQKIAQLKE